MNVHYTINKNNIACASAELAGVCKWNTIQYEIKNFKKKIKKK